MPTKKPNDRVDQIDGIARKALDDTVAAIADPLSLQGEPGATRIGYSATTRQLTLVFHDNRITYPVAEYRAAVIKLTQWRALIAGGHPEIVPTKEGIP